MSGARKRRPAQLRILPLTIFMGFMVLTVRVTDLVKGLYIQSSTAHAAAPKQGAAPSQKTVTRATTDTPPVGAPKKDAASKDVVFSALLDYKPEEVAIFTELSEKRAKLKDQTDSLHAQEMALKALKKKLSTYAQQIKETGPPDAKKIASQEAQKRDRKLADRAKIFQTMKPQDAARILSALSLETTLAILEKMSAMKSAPIIAAMPPEKASIVTEKLMDL